MRSILEELFYGNICPNTDCRSHNKETKQLMAYIAERPFRLYFRKGTLLVQVQSLRPKIGNQTIPDFYFTYKLF